MSSKEALDRLHKKFSLVSDRIRAVAGGFANGMYLYGRPGVSKTFHVRTTLDKLGMPHSYSNGFITAVGLFDKIRENPQSLIVLDDVTKILRDEKALQILLAAMGNSPDGSRVRTIRYKTAKIDETVAFEGGIIVISNLALTAHDGAVLAALDDRVQVVSFDPTDEEAEAYIYEIAAKGPKGVPGTEAVAVAAFLLDECRRSSVRPSVRLFLDKALMDYALWLSGRSESHWHDLIRASVQQTAIPQECELRDRSKQDEIENERRIVLNICSVIPGRRERVEAWTAKTGKGQSTFYRRLGELRDAGQLSA